MHERTPRPIPPEISALIRWTARKAYSRHVPDGAGRSLIELTDLEHQGILGWLEAPEYDEAQNTPIAAFARPYVYGRMMDFLRKTLALVRVPQDRWAEVRALRQAKEEIRQAGETPEPEKLAARLGWPVGKVASLERIIPRVAPIDSGDDGSGRQAGGSVEELVCEDVTPEQAVLRSQLARGLQVCLEELSPRDRLVVLGRRIESMKLKALAERLGCSMERVRQLEKRALTRLRECLEARGWTGIEWGVDEGALRQVGRVPPGDAPGGGERSDVS